jgi:predicted nuclease of restriction endonuclease-like (RecB) superfamily
MDSKKEIVGTNEYATWLRSLKSRVRQCQLKAAVAINQELLLFYWDLGQDIIEKQKNAGWGGGFLKQLSKDLLTEFPEIRGFSLSNIKYIRQWVQFWSADPLKSQQAVGFLDRSQTNPILQQADAKISRDQSYALLITMIPWGHNIKIISKCNTHDEALFYVNKTIEHGWSRSVLSLQLDSNLYHREGNAITNFDSTLPPCKSDIAKKLLRDPYVFDFLTVSGKHTEREIENSLVSQITKLLLELGEGFAYVGKQVPIEVNGDNFFIDLLFYHTWLHCYVVVELKAGNFKPEYTGKLNFYLKAVDELIRTEHDNKTIGILLCKNKNDVVAKYSLSDISKPIGISKFKLPQEILSKLPTIDELEKELKMQLEP